MFTRCFVDGHANSGRRPTAREWIEVLAPLASPEGTQDCRKNSLHVYPRHLAACPWCTLWQRLNVDYYDPRRQAPRTASNLPKVYSRGPAGGQLTVQVRAVPATGTGNTRLPPIGAGTPAGHNPRTGNTQPYLPPVNPVTPPGTRHASTLSDGSSALGYAARVLVALALAALFIFLNFAPSTVEAVIGKRRTALRQIRSGTRNTVTPNARQSGTPYIPLPPSSPAYVPAVPSSRGLTETGGQIEMIVPSASGPSRKYSVPYR